jgi:hypothetical protein
LKILTKEILDVYLGDEMDVMQEMGVAELIDFEDTWDRWYIGWDSFIDEDYQKENFRTKIEREEKLIEIYIEMAEEISDMIFNGDLEDLQ